MQSSSVRRGPAIRTASSRPYAPPLTTRYITDTSATSPSLRGVCSVSGAALDGAGEGVLGVGICGNYGMLRLPSLAEALRGGKQVL